MRTLPSIAAAMIVATPALAQDDAARELGAGVGVLAGLLIVVVIGGIVGWLASLIVKGSGLGLIGDIVLGIAGSFVAGLLLPMLGINIVGSAVGAIIASVAGAVVLLLLVRLIRRT